MRADIVRMTQLRDMDAKFILSSTSEQGLLKAELILRSKPEHWQGSSLRYLFSTVDGLSQTMFYRSMRNIDLSISNTIEFIHDADVDRTMLAARGCIVNPKNKPVPWEQLDVSIAESEMSYKDAAEMIGVHPDTVRKWDLSIKTPGSPENKELFSTLLRHVKEMKGVQ